MNHSTAILNYRASNLAKDTLKTVPPKVKMMCKKKLQEISESNEGQFVIK